MPATKVNRFGGMVPAIDPTMLPDQAAAYAENTWLYTGVLDAIPKPTLLRSCSLTETGKVFRIPNNYTDATHLLDAIWMEFTHPDTDVIRAPITDDSYDRYYWVSPLDVPRYNTRARIAANNTAWKLGVSVPSVAPGVTPAGGSGATVSRAYVYTWVTAYGEEGPPSPPTVVSGFVNATWNLTLTAPTAADMGTDRNITKTRIYRTVTSSSGVATYFFVAEITAATTAYGDTNTDTLVSANNQLESTSWSGPPSDLVGWVTMSNGMIAGWRNNEVWFCEPYRPHAWPAEYSLAVDYPIVGLGVNGQTLVICTQGYPYTLTGVHPSSVTQSRLTNFEPCTSRGSILSTPEGVYYGSPNGLVIVTNGSANIVTRDICTKDKWNQLVNISTMRAARLGTDYFTFGAARNGVFDENAFNVADNVFESSDYTGAYTGVYIDNTNTHIAFNLIHNELPCINLMNDAWSGELLIIRDNKVYWVNIADTKPIREVYKWRSKKFQGGSAFNISVCRVYFDVPEGTPNLSVTPNTALVQTLANDQYGLIRAYADDRLVLTRELRTSGEIIRLPSGFKADYWQFEFEARVRIKSFQLGSSIKELRKV